MNKPPLIAVIDDEPAILELVEAQLMQEKLTIKTYLDAGSFLADNETKSSCDLVMSDVMMPEMNGFELCRKIRDTERRFLPILLVTALNEVKSRVQGLDAGATDFLTKPTNSAELRARIRAHLRSKQFHDELAEANRQLENLGHLRDNLINMIVHDLRNPLSSVSMALDMMGDPPDPSAVDDVTWKLTREQVSFALELCQQLLDIKRFEGGEMSVKPSLAPAINAVQSALKPIILLASERQVTFKLDVPSEEIYLDHSLLQRILMNTLSNAVKYTIPGDSVLVRAKISPGTALFSVEDHGPGIPEKLQGEVFDLFVSTEMRSSVQSVGVGLNFCKVAASAMGGKTWLKSKLGEGTTFYFELPLQTPV